MIKKVIATKFMQNLSGNAAFYHRRCWEIYNDAPGLTCAAIAKQLGISLNEVHRYLGWLPYGPRDRTTDF